MTDTKIYHSVPFVARYYGISTGLLYKLCSSGEHPYSKFGKRIKISNDDIRMYEKKNHVLPRRVTL